jgi:hypothetical protein
MLSILTFFPVTVVDFRRTKRKLGEHFRRWGSIGVLEGYEYAKERISAFDHAERGQRSL